MTKNLKDKIAIVTGASRANGIGAAVCMSLAEAGADVFFTRWTPFDENEGNGIEKGFPEFLADKITNLGVRCAHMELDLSKADSALKLLSEVERTIGTPSILVNNATFESPSNFRSLNADILYRHYQVNNFGTIILSTEFAKRYEKVFSGQKGGRIINLVSGGPDPNNLAYIATKGAIIAITEPLSIALAPIGITVNSVNPGPTDTGWMSDDIKAQLTTLFPMGRVGVPEDAANLINFLASNESQWITGQVIKSEGGFLGK
ncbi:SDR family oxidoreductase [Falsibacillus pallidus]|uniref:3-oxoacyl-[acyl-carrier protein] reductase n=1 Tax=Falsibacillus pallidus TaxID=493781 RepID=A0A370GBE4_9BACI|nr:SDR family oxidoreductase [Falsibacillus pallidus]RDI41088.1 3-oxoacyl-[acyl-carrier protein] reductase [Falsibacillus pallidus]